MDGLKGRWKIHRVLTITRNYCTNELTLRSVGFVKTSDMQDVGSSGSSGSLLSLHALIRLVDDPLEPDSEAVDGDCSEEEQKVD